jgi:hypothetical protein
VHSSSYLQQIGDARSVPVENYASPSEGKAMMRAGVILAARQKHRTDHGRQTGGIMTVEVARSESGEGENDNREQEQRNRA